MLDILGRNKSLLRQCDIAGFLAIYSYFLSDISILPSENIRAPPLPSKKDNVEYFQMPASAWRLSRVGRRPKPKPNLGQNSRLLGSSAYPTVRGGGGDVSPQLERGKVNCEGKEEGAGAWMHEGEFAENDDSQAVLTTVASVHHQNNDCNFCREAIFCIKLPWSDTAAVLKNQIVRCDKQ